MWVLRPIVGAQTEKTEDRRPEQRPTPPNKAVERAFGFIIASLCCSMISLQEVWRIYSRGNAMTLEEIVVTKLQQLPENERQQLLAFIDT